MVNICILELAIYLATVGHLLVCKLKEVTIENLLAIVFKNLEKSSLTLRIDIIVELSEGQEVLPVHAVVSLVGQGERANIEASLGGYYAPTHPWLIFIQWGQVDSSVCILPESAPSAHHISARYTVHK